MLLGNDHRTVMRMLRMRWNSNYAWAKSLSLANAMLEKLPKPGQLFILARDPHMVYISYVGS